MAQRAIAFIDGFNLYHALDLSVRYRVPGAKGMETRMPYHQYKWLDLKKLCQCFLTRGEELAATYYFTALATWSPEKMERHTRYMTALEWTGVKIVHGAFREKEVYCTQCKTTFIKHEEKRTDVNIAIHLLGLAQSDSFDRALLVTGDSDLIPAVEWVRKQFPQKRISVIVPIARPVTKHLRLVANDHAKIKEDHLRRCQLPQTISLGDGRTIISPY